MEYDVVVPESACYLAEYRVATDSGSDGFDLSFAGELVDTVIVPSTGGWQNWLTLSSSIELVGGEQTMRFESLGGGSFNLNWFEFNQVDASQCSGDGTIT
jgi:glucan 1,3-beta-glucosidase